jgi:kynurenine formamidase
MKDRLFSSAAGDDDGTTSHQALGVNGATSAGRNAEYVDEAEFRGLYDSLRDAAARGPHDQRGALNNLTPEHRLAALREVQWGRSVSMAAPIETEEAADNPSPCRHTLISAPPGEVSAEGLHFAADTVTFNVHGNADSHIDALCHVIYEGQIYNGVPANVPAADGAGSLSIDTIRDGIVGRGVLLDIPRLLGVPWLEPGDHVSYDQLVRAAETQGTSVGTGDLLFVRVGHRRRRRELGPWDVAATRVGLHPDAMRFAAERRIAVLGGDGNNDTAPSLSSVVDFPVHVLAINAMGLHLLDYLQLDELASICAERRSWAFLCVIAPLRLPAATGSPVNPLAVV